MPATYEPIASQTLGSTAATVTFSSIPGTYTDLRLIITARSDKSAYPAVYLHFNSDTGTNYSYTELNGNGSGAASYRASSTSVYYPATAMDSGSTSKRAPVIVDVMSYANTNVFKTALWAGANHDASVTRAVSLWRSTSAITTVAVKLEPISGTSSFVSGSTFDLYGIKAA